MKSTIKIIIILLLILPVITMAAPVLPVKVFILAGQSNMQGQGIVTSQDENGKERPGTLVSMLKIPTKAPLLKNWVNAKGEWKEKRDDVWVYDISEFGERHGVLEFGYGWELGNRRWFGPEMQFGHLMGDRYENQVLIIKTAWGGKDLYKDFRPPSSGGEVGPYYTQMIETVKKVLSDLPNQFPNHISSKGFEISGFVWWHGWNDYCSPTVAAPKYEENLTNLIKDLRHDLNVPKLPVVIGELTGPWGADCKDAAVLTIRNAQKNVAEKPEFRNTVKYAMTHDFVRTEQQSPTDEVHHEFKNGETYFLVGDALAKALMPMLQK
jgi:hypothetical protein